MRIALPSRKTATMIAASIVAGAAGVGVAFAAAPGETSLNAITVGSRTAFTMTIGSIGQSPTVHPLGGHILWGDGEQGPATISCPTDATTDCSIVASHAYTDPIPLETFAVDRTMTGVMTIDENGTTTVRSTPATQPNRVHGTIAPSYDGFEDVDAGSARVGETGTPVLIDFANGAGADSAMGVYRMGVRGDGVGDFVVTSNSCDQIPPGGSCAIGVALRPTATGERRAELTVELTGSGDGENAEFSLVGTGLEAAPATTETTTVEVPGPTTTVTGPTTTVTGPSSTLTVTTPAATTTVTVPAAAVMCTVPALSGKTLAQATKALTAAHCRLGKVTKPKSPKTGLVVASQTLKAGAKRPASTRVGVRLAQKKTTRAKARRR